MECVRIGPVQNKPEMLPCCRCCATGGKWDRIAGKAYCPECQEALIQGLSEPLREPTQRNSCAACARLGTVTFLTFPLRSSAPVEMDLCPEHLRCLIGRRLGPFAFHQLRRRLIKLGLGVEMIFLLHDAFYDNSGQALQPAEQAE